MSEIAIPAGLIPPSRTDPQLLLLYSGPKVGKTTAVAALPDSLILEIEPAGADFVAARKIDVPDWETFVAALTKLIALREAKTPACKRLVIDTIDSLEILAKIAALHDYKRSVLGKDFKGTDLFELPQGAGYGRLRDKIGEWLWLCAKAADETILLGHVAEKYVERNGVQEVAGKDVNLTGKVGTIVCSRCSSIGYARRTFDDKLWVNFKTNDAVNCGSRCPHLTGKEILLGERGKDGTLHFNWSLVYRALNVAPSVSEAQATTTTASATAGAQPKE